MSNFYEAPREHATDSKNSPKGKPFKNASAQGLPSKEQHFSGAKDETRAHGEGMTAGFRAVKLLTHWVILLR